MRHSQRATHRGSCQICGAIQKLPNGKLSQHGYTRKWGFFNGVCSGAEYLPFEQDYSRVQYGIDRAKEQLSGLKAHIETLNGPVTDNKAPYQGYDSFRRMGYYETTVTVTKEADGRIMLQEESKDGTGKVHHGIRYGMFGSVEDAIRKLRDSKIARLQVTVEQIERYIVWQERRIQTWKPGELQPVKEAA